MKNGSDFPDKSVLIVFNTITKSIDNRTTVKDRDGTFCKKFGR